MPLWFAGSLNSETISPVFLSWARNIGPPEPGGTANSPDPSPANSSVLRDQQPDVLVAAGPRELNALQRRMVLDPVRRLAVGDHPR